MLEQLLDGEVKLCCVLPAQGCDLCWQGHRGWRCLVLLLRRFPSPWLWPGNRGLALGQQWWPSVQAGLDSVLILSKFCQASSPAPLGVFSSGGWEGAWEVKPHQK